MRPGTTGEKREGKMFRAGKNARVQVKGVFTERDTLEGRTPGPCDGGEQGKRAIESFCRKAKGKGLAYP